MDLYLFGQPKVWKNHITKQEQNISDTQGTEVEDTKQTVY